MEKQSYKQKNGTTRVGDALRWLTKNGTSVGKNILSLAGNITGIDALTKLGDAIKGNDNLSNEDKSYLLAQLEQDKIEMQEVTKRWRADMNSDSFLSKNIRPMTLSFLIIILFIFILFDSWFDSFSIKEHWVDLLSSLLLLVFGGYFGARSVEKVMRNTRK